MRAADGAPSGPAAGGDAAADPVLVLRVRQGDREAYAELWRRHQRAARNYAVHIAGSDQAPDLVAEAFVRVLDAIRRGRGPEGTFRPYLLTAIRRINVEWATRYHNRVVPVGDPRLLEPADAPGPSAADTVASNAEAGAALRAWAGLPDDAQAVLWHVVVEGEKPRQVANMLGVTPNVVSARTVRAKEKLRQGFLLQHLAADDEPGCRLVRSRFAGYVRDQMSRRDRRAIRTHLRGCRRCRVVLGEIADVNNTLRAVLAPLFLGGSALAARYLSARQLQRGTPAALGSHVSAQLAAAGWYTGATPRLLGAAATAAVAVLPCLGSSPAAVHHDRVAGVRAPAIVRELSAPAPSNGAPRPRPATGRPTAGDRRAAPAIHPGGPRDAHPPASTATSATGPTTAPDAITGSTAGSGAGSSGARPAHPGSGLLTATARHPGGSSGPAAPPGGGGTGETAHHQGTTESDVASVRTSGAGGVRGTGRMVVTVPDGWRITSVELVGGASDTCTVTGRTSAACEVTHPRAATTYRVALQVRGGADAVTADLQVTYADAVDTTVSREPVVAGGPVT